MVMDLPCAKLFYLLLFFMLSTLPADAAATPEGRSGLINIPTAYVLKPFHGGTGYFNFPGGDSFSGNIAVLPRVELGYSRWRSESSRDYNLYSGKVVLLEELVLRPAIAIGVDDIGGKLDRSYYLTVSKQGPWGIRLHLGARSGASNGLFYAMEKQIRLTDDWRKKLPFIPIFNLALEYDGQHFNYGAYVRNKHGFRLDLGWRDERFYYGVQLEF